MSPRRSALLIQTPPLYPANPFCLQQKLHICPFIFNNFHDAPPATYFLSTFCIVAEGWVGVPTTVGVKVLLELSRPFYSLTYILPSSVCSKSFASHSYKNRRGVPTLFSNRNANIPALCAARLQCSSAFPIFNFPFSNFAWKALLGEDHCGAAAQPQRPRGAALVYANLDETAGANIRKRLGAIALRERFHEFTHG